ncbi:hypothetical protein Pan216_37400 [Planctomycetes bacterium Pan216]|uniref:Uncharacterized protein n=1 Tax=Kolteria novifilia TaxID=2527975 RepID=A0A518B7B6_9BACT|nr:hypothetical protein Pan216_37400 [Planctomycetes bacterium Pan216]
MRSDDRERDSWSTISSDERPSPWYSPPSWGFAVAVVVLILLAVLAVWVCNWRERDAIERSRDEAETPFTAIDPAESEAVEGYSSIGLRERRAENSLLAVPADLF